MNSEPSDRLTKAEITTLGHLANAWNEFLALCKQHPDDIGEFRDAIHRAQQIVSMRVARRAHPELFINHLLNAAHA